MTRVFSLQSVEFTFNGRRYTNFGPSDQISFTFNNDQVGYVAGAVETTFHGFSDKSATVTLSIMPSGSDAAALADEIQRQGQIFGYSAAAGEIPLGGKLPPIPIRIFDPSSGFEMIDDLAVIKKFPDVSFADEPQPLTVEMICPRPDVIAARSYE